MSCLPSKRWGCVSPRVIALLRLLSFSGAKPSDGVPDMTVISDIDVHGINTNLKVRYKHDRIYVSIPNCNVLKIAQCTCRRRPSFSSRFERSEQLFTSLRASSRRTNSQRIEEGRACSNAIRFSNCFCRFPLLTRFRLTRAPFSLQSIRIRILESTSR